MKKRIRIAAVVLAALLLLGGLSVVAGAKSVADAGTLEDAVFPSWFSFPRDALSVHNKNCQVSQRFYTDMFGDVKGVVLSDFYESSGGHGLCYGISFANACLLNSRPAASSFASPTGAAYGSASAVPLGGVSDELRLPLLSFIKYCYVMQASSSLPATYEKHRNDAAGLRAAVADFVYNDGPAVAVGLVGTPSHEVLAVGLLGDEDIVILDSNDPEQLYVMDFTGSEWQYRCARYSWSSVRDDFDYDTNAAAVYEMIMGGGEDRDYSSENYAYTAAEEASGATDIYVTAMPRTDGDKLLVLYDRNLFSVTEEDLLFLGVASSAQFEDDRLLEYAWLAADKAAAVRGPYGVTCAAGAFGNRTGVIWDVPAGATATVTAAEGEPALLLTADPGDPARLVSLTPDGAGALARCVIKGDVSDGELFAVQTDGGLRVTGVGSAVVRLQAGGAAPVACKEDAFLVSVSADGTAVAVTVKGDADSDGRLTSADARLVLRLSVGLEPSERFTLYVCDYDEDGKTTSADARLILRRSVGLKGDEE